MTVFIFRLDPKRCGDRRITPWHHNRRWRIQRERTQQHRTSTMEGKVADNGLAWSSPTHCDDGLTCIAVASVRTLWVSGGSAPVQPAAHL
jgi:hypothetical protein